MFKNIIYPNSNTSYKIRVTEYAVRYRFTGASLLFSLDINLFTIHYTVLMFFNTWNINIVIGDLVS